MDVRMAAHPSCELGFYVHLHEMRAEHDIYSLQNTTERNSYGRVPTQHVPAKAPSKDVCTQVWEGMPWLRTEWSKVNLNAKLSSKC
jgi:hypothetical protein